jgi:filamentous hemagglutinin family protein
MPILRNSAVLGALLLVCTGPLRAQIAGDGTLGTAISRTGNAWSITAGTQLGGNLFHSFWQFGIPTGHSATFSGPTSVLNVISRVTGPDASNIDGLLRSTIPGANFWLINPKGVMFGANASIDVGGSFHVSTADYLKLGPTGQFNATNPSGSTLVSAPPSAFGFVNPTPAPISVDQSFLYMTPGKNLSILAGSVQVNDANLWAVGGRIDIAAVTGPGEVALGANGMVVPPSMALGPIGIARSLLLTDNDVGFDFSDTPGRVVVQGGTVEISGSDIYAGTFGTSAGGGVTLKATETLTIDNSMIYSDSFWSGRAGDLVLGGRDIFILNGSQLNTSANSSGAGGNVSITASDTVRVSGGGGYATVVWSESTNSATGSGGSVLVEAARIEVTDGGWITASTRGAGQGGNVTLRASEIVRVLGGGVSTDAEAGGNGGAVLIEAPRIEVANQYSEIYDAYHSGYISADTRGSGSSGNITLRASDTVHVLSGSVSTDSWAGGGNGGAVLVEAAHIEVNGSISAGTGGASQGGNVTLRASDTVRVSGGYVQTDTYGGSQGNGGAVLVEAAHIEVVGGGYVSANTYGSGSGGNVTLRATENVRLSGGGVETATASAQGNGGSVLVEAPTVTLSNGGYISAESLSSSTGNAGGITVNAADLLQLSHGGLSAETYGSGRGGNVNVVAGRIEMRPGSYISADSFGSGDGGNVDVRVGRLDMSPNSFVSADSTQSGRGGNVLVVATGSVSISGSALYGFLDAGITSSSITNGDAGSVFVSSPVLNIQGGFIASTALGTGAAGNVEVRAGQLNIGGIGVIDASTFGPGTGGTVTVVASNSVNISGAGARVMLLPDGLHSVLLDSGISSGAFGAGDAGSISISTPVLTMNGGMIRSTSDGAGLAGNIVIHADQSLRMAGGAEISTRALLSDGGNISIFAHDLVYLKDSSITTLVQSGSGTGGNIFIDPVFVVLDNSRIIASADGGNGGNINIVAGNFLSQNSVVDASSNLGISGNVQISAPSNDVNSGLVTLNAAYLDASNLIRQSCSARAARAGSTLMGAGRGGLAASPESRGGIQPGTGPAGLRLPVHLSSRQGACAS